MDVEAAEWGVFRNTPWCSLNISQVLVEIHDFTWKRSLRGTFEDAIWPLERCGFHLFSLEPVMGPAMGRQYEVGFIRLR